MWYFFRHGETVHNKYKISQGRFNSCLSLKGIEQAKLYASKIQKYEKDFSKFKYLTSPMNRAQQTLNIILEILNINPFEQMKEEGLLNDIDFGEHNNTANSIVWKNYYDDNRILYCEHPKGETFNDVYDRMIQFLEKYKNEENLVFATHGCCFGILQHILNNGKRNEFTRQNLIQDQNNIIKYDKKNNILELI